MLVFFPGLKLPSIWSGCISSPNVRAQEVEQETSFIPGLPENMIGYGNVTYPVSILPMLSQYQHLCLPSSILSWISWLAKHSLLGPLHPVLVPDPVAS